MLTPADRNLISFAVDGELTPTQEIALRRLLAENPTARLLHNQLLAQSELLKRLPRAAAPAVLAANVMARIPLLPVTVPATPATKPHTAPPRWVPMAVAASLFFGVAFSSFWFAQSWQSNSPNIGVARQQSLPRPTPGPDGRDQPTIVALAIDRTPESLDVPPRIVDRKNPTVVAVETPNQSKPEPIASPRVVIGDVVGAALLNDPKPLASVEVRLPLLIGVAELDQPHAQTRLKEELARESAYRLDLFVHDTHRAAELFQAAAKSAGIAVTWDAVAQDRLRRKLPVAFAVFVESLTADDVAKLASQIAIQDRVGPKPVFDLAHLIPAKTAEQRELRDLLGIDPGLWKRPTTPETSGKSLTASTVDQVAAALAKSKTTEKPALMLTYWPVVGRVNPAMSKEVREFLARRADRKPGELPLFIVIRPTAN